MFSLLARAKVDFHFDSPGQPNQSPLFIILIFIWMMVLDLLIIDMELELLFLCYCSLCVRTKYSMIIWEFTLRIIRFAEQHKISRIESSECYIQKQQQPQRLSRMLARSAIYYKRVNRMFVYVIVKVSSSLLAIFLSPHISCVPAEQRNTQKWSRLLLIFCWGASCMLRCGHIIISAQVAARLRSSGLFLFYFCSGSQANNSSRIEV